MNQAHNHGYITVQGIDNDILVKASEILSFLNEKIINEIFMLSQKEKKNLIDSLNNEKDGIINEEDLIRTTMENTLANKYIGLIENKNDKENDKENQKDNYNSYKK